MSRDGLGQKNATPRNNRPYDVSNSFVRRVASRVSGLFGGLFSPADSVESRINAADNEPNTQQSSSNSALHSAVSPAPYEAFRNHLSVNPTPASSHTVFNSTPGPSGVKRRFGDADEIGRPGPSGLKLRDDTPLSRGSKFPRYESVEPKNNAGDDHSESSESTSGCSSLVPQADRLSQSALASSARRKNLALDEKLNYARQLKQSRSYLNRSIPIHAESPRPSRTPSFDLSVYGKPILNSSVRETMLSSPYYTGQTTYGGASARRSGFAAQPSPRNVGSQIAVKPVNEERDGANMSQTAKRILSALEELSTPLNDAKRIPTPVPPLAAKRRNIEVNSASSGGAKRQALEVPTVADLLKLRRLEEIQDSMTMARQVTVSTREPSPTPTPSRWTGKIVTKKKDRGKPVEDPPPTPPQLPKVPLKFTSLPIITLTTTMTTTTTATAVSSVATTAVVATAPVKAVPAPPPPPPPRTTTTPVSNQFEFSLPSAMSSDWKNQSCNGVEFTFTDPSTADWLQPKPLTSVMAPDAIAKLKRKPVEKTEDEVGVVSPVKNLSTGSVMDILSKTPAAEKSTNGPKISLNSSEKSAPKTPELKLPPPVTTTTTSFTGFGDQFKPAAGSWSCEVCLVSNKPDANKCISCETVKPGRDAQKGFGDKFKPAVGSWTCDICMVSNAANVTKCVACESPKPGTETTKPVTKTSGAWTCSVCLISNKEGVTKCAACESPQPNGPLSTGPKTSFNFSSLPSTNSTFKFGIDKAGGESVANGPNKDAIPAAPATVVFSSSSTSSFSSTTPSISASGFTFGIPKSQETLSKSVSDETDTIVPKNIDQVKPVTPSFSFGIPAAVATPAVSKPTVHAAPLQPFSLNGPAVATEIKSFNIPALPEKPAAGAPFTFTASKPVAPGGVFKFGDNSGGDSKTTTTTTTGVFRFGEPRNLLSQPGGAAEKPAETNPPPVVVFPAFGSTFATTTPAAPFSFGKAAESPFGQINTAPPSPFTFGAPTPTPTPAFNPPASGFGTPFAATPMPAFATPAAPGFSALPGSIAPGFGGSSSSASPFGAANTTPAFGLPSATVTPFAPAANSVPAVNFTAPTQPAFGQSTPAAFPATNTSSPFQFNAGNASSSAPVLTNPSNIQFNIGQAPSTERRTFIRAKRRSQK